MDNIYDGYRNVTWDDLSVGDTCYIDNYENGKFPLASPKISGPYTVISTKDRVLETNWKVLRKSCRSFKFYNNNLLVKA